MANARPLSDELRPLFRGRISSDDLTCGLYSTDASPFQIMPLAVAVPQDEDDLRVLVRYCHEQSIPLIPRGAGTGLAGESLGHGVVVDLSVNFRKILEVGSDFVRAQPGVTLTELNQELARIDRRFAPDPSSGASCTLGGMIATNASGGTAYLHGYTRDHVLGLRVVWDNGEVDCINDATASPTPLLQNRTEQLQELLLANRGLIELTRPHTPFNRCGYLLHDMMKTTPNRFDMARFLVGSEGTLALITEATLRTIPTPGGTCVCILGFASLEAALKLGIDFRHHEGIAGCDLLDQRLLSLARMSKPGDTGLSVIPTGAALILTFEAETEREAFCVGAQAIDSIRSNPDVLVIAEPTCNPEGTRRIRTFREAAVSGLYALTSGRRPEAFIEDVAVPAEEIGRFVTGVQEILREDELSASFLVHVLAGQVHTRPLIDLANDRDREKLWPIAEKVNALALSLNGTISSQHGVGIARTPWVEKQYGPLMPVFRELKRIFDPKGIFNPGKIVGPDPSRPAWPLRELAKQKSGKAELPLLLWSSSPEREATKCNGCGDCRPRGNTTRMCPVFHATGDEQATPRAKANLLRWLRSESSTVQATSDEVREVTELCVNCKMCRSECRAGVDIPKLMLEAKAAHQAENGLTRTDWFLSRAESFAALASNFAFSSNLLLGTRWARWLLEKLLGLSRHRMLPRFTHRTFLRRARRMGLSSRAADKPRTRKLAYFVDTFANRNDPLIALATVEVLRANGYEVHVPRKQRSSGMAPLAYGDVDSARDIAAYNVRTLADLVRDDYQIVCSEPTAAVALTQDYPSLLDDPDVGIVAAQTVELTALLGRLLDTQQLVPPSRALPWSLGHHVPCHIKALGGTPSGPRLLAQIPELKVHTIDVSCSGMAGTWGLAARQFELSMETGKPMFAELDRPRVWFGSTECSSCRMQMQQGTGKRTLHPVQYLALSYGMLPEIERLLARPLRPLSTE